jgi:arsenical pump membrane protein
MVFAVAAGTTAVLSLDATVLLLTPVVLATASRLRTNARPHVYACAHLANSASLLLPVSNLTNLLAFDATGLSFARFAAMMALPGSWRWRSSGSCSAGRSAATCARAGRPRPRAPSTPRGPRRRRGRGHAPAPWRCEAALTRAALSRSRRSSSSG